MQSGKEETDNSANPAADSDATTNADANEQVFFSVSTKKLIVLDVLFFGLYALFWIYKNWKYLKETRDDKCFPLVWTIFAPISFFDLAAKMIAVIKEKGGSAPPVPAGLLGVIFFACNFLGRFDHPAAVFFSVLSFVPLALLQSKVNAVSGGEAAVTNKKFSVANVVFCVIGALLWVLVILSMFIKD